MTKEDMKILHKFLLQCGNSIKDIKLDLHNTNIYLESELLYCVIERLTNIQVVMSHNIKELVDLIKEDQDGQGSSSNS